MTKFVLVHGAWHGGWFWSGVAQDLQARGYQVIAVDLPGRGNTPARRGPLWGWRTGLRDCVTVVRKAMEPGDEPIVLAGHSLGGITITQVGEDVAERIKSLVYVAAMLPRNGESAINLSHLMLDSPVRTIARLNPLSGTTSVKPEESIATFYNECNSADIEYASQHLTPELIRLPMDKVYVTETRWGRLNKLYVQCNKDRAIPPMTQQAMGERAGVSRIKILETGHSPNYSMRSELVDLLAAEA